MQKYMNFFILKLTKTQLKYSCTNVMATDVKLNFVIFKKQNLVFTE